MAHDGGTPDSGRRRLILDSAGPLFAERGIAGTTVRDIANAAGLLSGALYHQFPSKEAIATAIVREYLDEQLPAYREIDLTRPASERLEALITASLEVMHRFPHATRIYAADSHHLREAGEGADFRTITNELQQHWLDVLEDGVRTGVFRPDLDTRVAFRLIRDGLWLTVRWFTPTDFYPLSRLSKECAALYSSGVVAR